MSLFCGKETSAKQSCTNSSVLCPSRPSISGGACTAGATKRKELARFRGREVNTIGDAFIATFDGPARAIRCACSIRDAVSSLGLQIRAGLHTGEIELTHDDIGGIAVHIGARVVSAAQPSEVLVSSTVKDLVSGSAIGFVDRGMQVLKGIPGRGISSP
ncbi:MAG: adenylate/guanylate cyclase domain-containing protein [Chthoniobacterales bacterium]|nr:adenylate/guanylate cyclase domain-containing protein [Chthoniobacterales bacterium]